MTQGFAQGGEKNTASNVGTGTGLFKQKVDQDLEFHSIKAENSDVEVTDIGDEIQIGVVTSTTGEANKIVKTGGDGLIASNALPVISMARYFGNGADGASTLVSNTTLDGASTNGYVIKQYTDLDLGGYTLDFDNCNTAVIYVSGTLDFGAGGAIESIGQGQPAVVTYTDTVSGAGAGAVYVFANEIAGTSGVVSANGETPADPALASVANTDGKDGVAAEFMGGQATARAATGNSTDTGGLGGQGVPANLSPMLLNGGAHFKGASGGSGGIANFGGGGGGGAGFAGNGGDGGSGGGGSLQKAGSGGGGGGLIVISTLTNSLGASLTLEAVGGGGSNSAGSSGTSGSGGGGGGGGGIIYFGPAPSPTYDVSAGAAGVDSGTGGTDGTAGEDGITFEVLL